MTVGTGIFLSAILLAVALLYITTKERWKWRRGLLRVGASLIGLIAVLVGGTYAYYLYADRVQRAESLWGIELGASRGDVKFAKGAPSDAEEKREPSITDPRWIYKTGDVIYGVYFENDRVTRIVALGKPLYLPTLPGVSLYGYISDVIKPLGPPGYVSRSRDETRRIYSFPKYNVAIGGERGEVYLIAVGVTNSWPVRLTDDDEK